MAFANFYLVAGGAGAADINAGSTTGAAQATTTNGNWNSATGVFVAASGTPFASTVVGDYASIYVDGATVAVYVAKVKTVTDSTHIVVDTTVAMGTAPSTNATARSCTINGAWATEQVLAAGGLATTTVPQSTKINITGNLTITASRTITMAGTTTAPLWFSGYSATPGDLDADTTNSLAKPVWTQNAGFVLQTQGAHQTWSSLSVTGNRSGSVWAFNSSGTWKMVRCRCTNTSTNSAAIAWNLSVEGIALYCYAKCPTTATANGSMTLSSGVAVGCVAEGGGLGCFQVTGSMTFVQCVALNGGAAGISVNSGQVVKVAGCTVYNCVDGIKWVTSIGANQSVTGCLFSTLTNGLNNSIGSNTNAIIRACNDYATVTNAEVGFGDSPAFFPQTDSGAVVTSATDLTPLAGSNARFNGFPGIFENEAWNSYVDIGSTQHRHAGRVLSSPTIAGVVS